MELPAQPRVTRAWYVAAFSADIGPSPYAITIFDVPLVLWRDGAGEVRCLVDRCPHRGVPLSDGTVVEGELQCGYHGWRFDGEGATTRIPGMKPGSPLIRCASAHPVREVQGLIWVWMAPDEEPNQEPFHFPVADKPGYTTVRRAVRMEGSLHQVVENALDVPHTGFLHAGLFRGDTPDRARKPVEVQVRRWSDGCEVEFIGEERPGGLAGRLLSPSGGELVHVDRFYLPCITEVEYRLGTEAHLMLSSACTPHSDWSTTMFAVVSVRTRLPGWLVRAAVEPVAMRILYQDAELMRRQTQHIAQFGHDRFIHTEVDLLGAQIMTLLKRAEKAGIEPRGDEPPEWEKPGTLYL